MRTVIYLIVGLLMHSTLVASPELDSEFGYRSLVSAVINVHREPIFGEHVESDLISEIRRNSRFDFSDEGYVLLREYLNNYPPPPLGREPSSESLTKLIPLLNDLRSMGIQAVLLGEIFPEQNERPASVVVSLYKTSGDLVMSSSQDVKPPRALANYSTAAKTAFADVFKGLPFEATIISRDGYNVVIDRGATVFRSGMSVPAFTVERNENTFLFEETGTIGITRAESQLSFGKILVEKKPKEISVGNKIRLARASDNATDAPPILGEDGTPNFSGDSTEKFETEKGKFGMVNVNLLGSSVTFINTGTAGENSVSKIAPGITFQGELWLTSRLFTQFNYKYAFARMALTAAQSPPGGNSQSISMSLWDISMGYRINLAAPETGPILHARLGFGGRSFSFEEIGPVIFTTSNYSGLVLGGGVHYQFNRKVEFGLDLNSLIFAGLEETPVTSGLNTQNVSAWQLALKGSYAWKEDMDWMATLFFERFGAEFTGAGTRTGGTINATSQSAKGLLLGISYYF